LLFNRPITLLWRRSSTTKYRCMENKGKMDLQRRMPARTVWNSSLSYRWRTTGLSMKLPSSISGIHTIGPCSSPTILKHFKS
jgi:hypothetical protein